MPLLFGNTDLTSKEWAITALVSRGRTNAQIAAEIQTTEHVVGSHLRRIFEKIGCWNRTEIALWYLKMGLEKESRLYDINFQNLFRLQRFFTASMRRPRLVGLSQA